MLTIILLLCSLFAFEGSSTLDLDPAFWWYAITAPLDLLLLWGSATTGGSSAFD